MIVTIDEQQKPVTSASIAILTICLQQACNTPCASGSLSTLREPDAQGVLAISDSIESATETLRCLFKTDMRNRASTLKKMRNNIKYSD